MSPFGKNYCSRVCYVKHIPWNKNKKMSKECREINRKSHIGQIPWNKDLKGWSGGEKNGNWQGGSSRKPYPFNFDEELKELIRKRDNYLCQECGMSEIENGRKLDIHHIDYNKMDCDPNNLITLCRVCNCRVNGNREYWEKYFKNFLEVRNNVLL